jgi:hypothetical protein
MSNSSIFVEMDPGLSYTAALYFFGMSTEPILSNYSLTFPVQKINTQLLQGC